MRQRSIPLATLALAIIVQASLPAKAQESSRPWWNPFASGETSSNVETGPVRDSSLFNGGGESYFKLPEWRMPSFSSEGKKTAAKNKPSTISRMGRTTKRWWGNTVDFLNPFEKKESSFSQGYQPQNVTKKSGDGLFGWMWREETTETPTTVNDFLRQPRPRF